MATMDKKVRIASIAILLSVVIILIVVVTIPIIYPELVQNTNTDQARPIVYVSFNWNNSSGFRSQYFNGDEYHTLSPGQIGIVNITFTSVPWSTEDQFVQLYMTVGNTLGDPKQYYLPENVSATALPDHFTVPVNGTVTVSLIINASYNAEIGTWQWFTLDVATGIHHEGPNFKFAIANN
jgi:hypothetical protein